MFKQLKIFLCLGIINAVFTAKSDNNNLKLVIDNDAGGDDAMAIFIALLNEKHYGGPKLVALTTGNGNTNENNVCVNNQRILKVAGRQDIPIYRGANSSIAVTPKTNAYYGNDGLGDTGEIPEDLVPAQEKNAILRLVELSKEYEGELVVVTIGTLTNVALAVKFDPGFINRLAQLYVAAGHIYSDIHPMAEFNAKMDAEAYHIIAQSANPDKVTLFPFSQTQIYLNFTRDWRTNELGSIDSDIMRAQNKFEQVSLKRPGGRWHSLDPSAVAAVVNPDLVKEYKYSKNDIILCGEQRGINTNEFVKKKDANVRVVFSIKDQEYKQFLLDLFKKSIST